MARMAGRYGALGQASYLNESATRVRNAVTLPLSTFMSIRVTSATRRSRERARRRLHRDPAGIFPGFLADADNVDNSIDALRLLLGHWVGPFMSRGTYARCDRRHYRTAGRWFHASKRPAAGSPRAHQRPGGQLPRAPQSDLGRHDKISSALSSEGARRCSIAAFLFSSKRKSRIAGTPARLYWSGRRLTI